MSEKKTPAEALDELTAVVRGDEFPEADSTAATGEDLVFTVGGRVLLTPEGAQHFEQLERESTDAPKIGIALAAAAETATLAGDPNWLWAMVWAAWLVLEGVALAIASDRLQPNTYWVRKAPRWVRVGGVLALCGFLVQHFVFCGAACG